MGEKGKVKKENNEYFYINIWRRVWRERKKKEGRRLRGFALRYFMSVVHSNFTRLFYGFLYRLLQKRRVIFLCIQVLQNDVALSPVP